MKASRVDIVGIECLQVIGDNSEVGVVFFHGYGANMHDLFPLWEMWHEEKFNWYFPNGVQSLPMGYYEGRAWFQINIEELERSIREGKSRDMKKSIPAELDQTLGMLENLLQELSKKHKKLIIGGFSQGAMCASHIAMRGNVAVDGLILLSGALLAEERLTQTAKGIPFYQSHGEGDPILSLDGAKDLEAKLLSKNFQGRLHTFKGGHEIPPKVIHEVKGFLQQFVD